MTGKKMAELFTPITPEKVFELFVEGYIDNLYGGSFSVKEIAGLLWASEYQTEQAVKTLAKKKLIERKSKEKPYRYALTDKSINSVEFKNIKAEYETRKYRRLIPAV